jgi:hypothetical protein
VKSPLWSMNCSGAFAAFTRHSIRASTQAFASVPIRTLTHLSSPMWPYFWRLASHSPTFFHYVSVVLRGSHGRTAVNISGIDLFRSDSPDGAEKVLLPWAKVAARRTLVGCRERCGELRDDPR